VSTLVPIGVDELIPIEVDDLIPMEVSDLFSRPHYYFILSLGPRVHFRGQKLIFWQKKSKIKKN
jgi:hypothetical protein